MITHSTRSSIISLIVFIFCQFNFPSNGFAQSEITFANRNNVEIGGNVSYEYQEYVQPNSPNAHTNTLSLLPYVGYFVGDGIEIGLNPVNITSIWTGRYTATQYTFFLAPSYNLKTNGLMYPFIEGQIGYTAVVSSYYNNLNGFCWGARGGTKIVIAQHGLINISLQYQQLTHNPSGASGRFGENDLTFSAGFTLWY